MLDELSLLEWLVSVLVGIGIGFAKTAVATLGIFNVALLVQVFPAKESVGIMLPMLIMGDIFAVIYYRRSVVWKYLFSLVPWVLIGILSGYFVLMHIKNDQLSLLLGILILSLIILQFCKDSIQLKVDRFFQNAKWFTYLMGILAGFATMIGNVSGVIMSIYLLSKGLPKKEFIGTGAWFYLFVNIIKIPFFLSLGMIASESIVFNLTILPFILIGCYIGIKIVKLIPQKIFQWTILILGILGSINLIILNW
ncbi:sulfite exporter TauE/SafE family protein [Litchfieldia alkalitelluris]|uniref:sulfite exporter TauE/SafE family protein n=1 Tax=Litchfieldia alkalitelluris TaxID=304268 RepID=UPI000997C7BE|nr:sulfite exporter TauE/SafE family protein [Litchfieldia alkalitelluris]